MSDSAKHYYLTSGITVPLNSSVACDVGTVIYHRQQQHGDYDYPSVRLVTLQLANSTSAGTRSLASNGIATLIKVAVNTWYCSRD